MLHNQNIGRATPVSVTLASEAFHASRPDARHGDDRRVWLITAVLLVLCWLVKGWPWLSGAVTIPWDAKAHFQAQIAFMAQSFARGESPFWAPQIFIGHPQIADPQSMLFSPPHVLLAWLTPTPSIWAVDVTTYLILLFGGFGVLGFGRDKKWHPAAALVAALAFAMAGSMHWRNQHTGQIFSIAYLPWALWMLDRALRRSSWLYGALSGLFAGLMLLDPDQVAYLSMLMLAGFVLSYWCEGPGIAARIRGSIGPLAAGAAVGLALTLVPMLMVLSFAEVSNRAKVTFDDAASGSIHPSSIFTIVIPNLYGIRDHHDLYWGAPSQHWPYIVKSWLARNMTNFYIGLLPLAGIICWLTSPAAYRRNAIIFAAMFGFMFLYSLGKYTPLFEAVFTALPGADLFRRPADALFNLTAAGAILSGFGLTALLNGQLKRPRLAYIVLAGFIALNIAGGIGMALWLKKLGQSGHEIVLASALAVALGLVLVFGQRLGQSRPMAVLAVFALAMTADISFNMRPCESTGLPPSRYEALRIPTTDETIVALKSRIVQDGDRRDRVELTGLGFEMPNVPLIQNLESTLGYNPLRLKHFVQATGAGDQVAGVDQHKFGPLFNSYHSPFAKMMGLRFIAIGLPIEQAEPGLKQKPLTLVARTKDAYIYENPNTFPRVMVVPEAQPADQDMLVTTGQWPRREFRRVAFVEPTSSPLPKAANAGAARILAYGNAEVRVGVEAPEGGLLVLHDAWHPWWEAEVDGKATPVLRTNGVFRGVILPPGAKQVTFTFRPFIGLCRQWHLCAARPG